MDQPLKRRPALHRAWQNLIIRTAAYYLALLGGIAALWRWFPDGMRVLTRNLAGDPKHADTIRELQKLLKTIGAPGAK